MSEPHAPRVAVVGPFSGPRASWGRLLVEATAVARGVIGWEHHDDQGDPALAQRCAEKIASDGGYTAVVGHFNSVGARAALASYRATGLPCLLPLATAPGLTSAAPRLVLRWCGTDQGQAVALMRALAAAGHREVGVVTDGSAQMRGLAGLLLSTPVDDVARRELAQGMAAGDGAVIVVAAHYRAAEIARQLRESGFRGRLAFGDDCAVAEFAQLAGEAAAGALVAQHAGGAAARVAAAVWTLAEVLSAEPSLAGRRLVPAIRGVAPVAFTPLGELTAESSTAWTVRPLPGQALVAERP